MIFKNVTLYVKEECIEEFKKATIENQQNSRKEDGIVAFEFFQCKDDVNKFLLYEGYRSEEDMDKHLETEHFKKWINEVEHCFSAPRERIIYEPVTL